ANMLVGLPDYTARVRIKDDTEHVIQTIQPEKGMYGKLLQDRIARIQAQNRTDGYVRERITVEGEITKRQTKWGQQPKQPQQPQQGRRMLVCQKCGAQNRQGAKFCKQCGGKI